MNSDTHNSGVSGGSSQLTLTPNQVPVKKHRHGMMHKHTVDMSHTHNLNNHTHSIEKHTHGMVHTHGVSLRSDGSKGYLQRTLTERPGYGMPDNT